MDINLRLIRQDSIEDRTNYFALQKSVALFPEQKSDNKKEYEDKFWQDQFENKNRICYVIETVPEALYCGECAVKDISADIPEVEIELMKKYQHQGIGYKAIIMMLNKLAQKYNKQEFYAKIEPDNYASQFLFEKLDGMPVGLVRDFAISDERVGQFIDTHRDLLDDKMQHIAKKFDVEPELLLTNLLVYKLDVKAFETAELFPNKREYIDCARAISREKYKDTLREHLEDLEELMSFGEDNDKIMKKLKDMEAKLLKRIEILKTTSLDINI